MAAGPPDPRHCRRRTAPAGLPTDGNYCAFSRRWPFTFRSAGALGARAKVGRRAGGRIETTCGRSPFGVTAAHIIKIGAYIIIIGAWCDNRCIGARALVAQRQGRGHRSRSSAAHPSHRDVRAQRGKVRASLRSETGRPRDPDRCGHVRQRRRAGAGPASPPRARPGGSRARSAGSSPPAAKSLNRTLPKSASRRFWVMPPGVPRLASRSVPSIAQGRDHQTLLICTRGHPFDQPGVP
jgi:hypothetical protein